MDSIRRIFALLESEMGDHARAIHFSQRYRATRCSEVEVQEPLHVRAMIQQLCAPLTHTYLGLILADICAYLRGSRAMESGWAGLAPDQYTGQGYPSLQCRMARYSCKTQGRHRKNGPRYHRMAYEALY